MFNIFSSNQVSVFAHIICAAIWLGIISSVKFILENASENGKLLLMIAIFVIVALYQSYIMFFVSVFNQKIVVGYIGFLIFTFLFIRDMSLNNYQYNFSGFCHYIITFNAVIYILFILFTLSVILMIDSMTGGIDDEGIKIFIKIFCVSFALFFVMAILVANRVV